MFFGMMGEVVVVEEESGSTNNGNALSNILLLKVTSNFWYSSNLTFNIMDDIRNYIY